MNRECMVCGGPTGGPSWICSECEQIDWEIDLMEIEETEEIDLNEEE